MGPYVWCAWDECESPGHDENKVISRNDAGADVHYIFCTERHKQFWLASPRGNGQLPSGVQRKLWLPGGIPGQ